MVVQNSHLLAMKINHQHIVKENYVHTFDDLPNRRKKLSRKGRAAIQRKSSAYYCSDDGLTWRAYNIEGREVFPGKDNPITDDEGHIWYLPTSAAVRHAMGFQFHVEYSWTAILQFDSKAPAVGFTVSRPFIEALARLRDIPPGKKKRSRLIHEVEEHLRRKPSGKTTKVSHHMRAWQDHIWNGCLLRVCPPWNTVNQIKLKNGGVSAKIADIKSKHLQPV